MSLSTKKQFKVLNRYKGSVIIKIDNENICLGKTVEMGGL